MLSEEEKAAITERVLFENNLRQELIPPHSPTRPVWYESKLVLLLIGAAISGLLVPAFQFTQDTISWEREVKRKSVDFRLEVMRKALKEFSLLASYASEGYERTVSYLDLTAPSDLDRREYRDWYDSFQSRRLAKTADILGLLIYFDNDEKLKKTLEKYQLEFAKYIKSLKSAVRSDSCQLGGSPDRPIRDNAACISELIKQSDPHIGPLNLAYAQMTDSIRSAIRALENES
jgi:hypothetical protein